MCREYAAPINRKDSRQFASVDADQEIGPVLSVGIATIADVPGIEVHVPSLSDPWPSIGIWISRSEARFVNKIHRHNVSFESVKLASGNHGHGSEDPDTSKSNDKPSFK